MQESNSLVKVLRLVLKPDQRQLRQSLQPTMLENRFFSKDCLPGMAGPPGRQFFPKPALEIFSMVPDKTCIQSEPISIPKHEISDSQKSWEEESQLPKTQQSQPILKTNSHLPTGMSSPLFPLNVSCPIAG